MLKLVEILPLVVIVPCFVHGLPALATNLGSVFLARCCLRCSLQSQAYLRNVDL